MTEALADAPADRRPPVLSSPSRFARACVSVAVALAILGLTGLVDGMLVYPLAALVVAFAGLAALIPVEERQHALRAGRGSAREAPATAADDGGPGASSGSRLPSPSVLPSPPRLTGPATPSGPVAGPTGLDELAMPPPPLTASPSSAEREPEPSAAAGDPGPERPSGAVVRTFRLPAAVDAERAWVVGEFNDWSRTAHPMVREGDELVARIPLEPGRAYRYRYLLDGDRWENDWQADRYEPNGFGGEDSVALT